MDVIKYLNYNFSMKKLLLLFIVIFSFSTVHADEITKSQQAIAYYNDNNIEQAIKILESIPENDKNAGDWLLMGNLLQDKNKNPEAVFMFKRAILVDKNFYKPYYNLANIYLEEDRPLMAIENYKHVIKLKPDFPYAYYNIGCAYLKLGDYKKAKKYFSKAVELKNTEADFQYNLAYCYKKLNKIKLANRHLEYYNKIIETH